VRRLEDKATYIKYSNVDDNSHEGNYSFYAFNSANKQDPYVLRATERAKDKIRNKIFELNKGNC